MRICAFISKDANPNPLSVLGPYVELHKPHTVCGFLKRFHADIRLSMRINRNACAPLKKIRMANSSHYQEATIIQYLSTMSNILRFSVSKNESLPVHNGFRVYLSISGKS